MVKDVLQASVQTGTIGGLHVDPEFLRVNQLQGTAPPSFSFFQGPSDGSVFQDSSVYVSPGSTGLHPQSPRPPSSFLSPWDPYPQLTQGGQNANQPGLYSSADYHPGPDQQTQNTQYQQFQPPQNEQVPSRGVSGRFYPVRGPWGFPQDIPPHTHQNGNILWHRTQPQLVHNHYLPPSSSGFVPFGQPQIQVQLPRNDYSVGK